MVPAVVCSLLRCLRCSTSATGRFRVPAPANALLPAVLGSLGWTPCPLSPAVIAGILLGHRAT
eukprot:11670528-Alexandrium_andersonii.AAC.1